MSAEENEAVVRRYIEEVWNGHDLTNFEELVADDHFATAWPSPNTGTASRRPGTL